MTPNGNRDERTDGISRAPESMRGDPCEKMLKEALGFKERELISLVGAGGKTSLMFLLARTLQTRGRRVVTTTTTKILAPGPEETPFLSLGETEEAILTHVSLHGHVTVVSQRVAQKKFQGISPKQVDALWRSDRIDYLIVEADGAAGRPLKAPESYEPVIPACTGIVVALLGAEAIGAVLSEEKVFRSCIFSRLTGLPIGAKITPEAISQVFTHRDGILRGAPGAARIVFFVNKVDLDEGLRKGRELASVILDSPSSDPRIDRVVLGQLRSDPPIVEVIVR